MSSRKSFYSGLGAGLVMATALTLWISVQMEEPFLEVDLSRSLGRALTPPPPVALRPLSWEDLSKNLGYQNPLDLREEAALFAERIAEGYLPSGFRASCRHEHNVKYCEALEDYFDRTAEISLKDTRKGNSHAPQKSFTAANVADLQREDAGQLLSRSPDLPWAQIQALGERSLKTTDCPHSLSLALARMSERFLNQPETWALMDRLDAHGVGCLKIEDSGAEFIFTRIGLLKVARKLYAEAIPLFQKALEVPTRKEDHRTLYWLVRSHLELGQHEQAQKYRQQLFRRHPLAWQTIKSYRDEDLDPLTAFEANPAYPDLYASKKKEIDLRFYWLRVMLLSPDATFATKKYAEFVIKLLDVNVPPGVFQHLARLLDHGGLHRVQIIALNRLMSLHPDRISTETLRLLYPKPFFEQLDSQSGNVDTAILLGLVRQESGFDPSARSAANAVGLLQILPSTARGIQKSTSQELYGVEHNIKVGSIYFESLTRMFNNSVERALAAYNAGQGRVRSWDQRFSFANQDTQLYMDLIPYRETREYVALILRNAYWYHRLFPELTLAMKPETLSSPLLMKHLGVREKNQSPTQ